MLDRRTRCVVSHIFTLAVLILHTAPAFASPELEEGKAARLEALLERRPLPFPIALDTLGERGDALGLIGVPATALVGADGRVLERLHGPQDWQNEGFLARID